MDKTKGKDLHKAVRNRGMVLIAIGTAVMGFTVFFCCIYIRIRMKKYSAH